MANDESDGVDGGRIDDQQDVVSFLDALPDREYVGADRRIVAHRRSAGRSRKIEATVFPRGGSEARGLRGTGARACRSCSWGTYGKRRRDMPVEIRDQGTYELFETNHGNRILVLNNQKWVRLG